MHVNIMLLITIMNYNKVSQDEICPMNKQIPSLYSTNIVVSSKQNAFRKTTAKSISFVPKNLENSSK